jgi:DNA polymerase-3 subunit chi
MPQLDCYILPQKTPQARLDFTCRLTEKLFKKSLRIHILLDTQEQMNTLDTQLWSSQPNSFLPHDNSKKITTPLTLGLPDNIPENCDVLINLSQTTPLAKRIVEIIPENETIKKEVRRHYQYYQQQKFTTKVHKITC